MEGWPGRYIWKLQQSGDCSIMHCPWGCIIVYIYFYFKIIPFVISGCAGSLLLHRLFSSCCGQGLLSSCSVRAYHCSGFASWGAWALGCRLQQAPAVAVRGLSSCGSKVLEHRLRSCGAQTWLLGAMWDLLGSRIKPVSLALAGRFLTFGPPGKSSDCVYFQLWYTSTFWRLNTISGCVLYVKRSKDNIIFYDTDTFLILTTLNWS